MILLLGETFPNYYGLILLHVQVNNTLYWYRLASDVNGLDENGCKWISHPFTST